MCLQIHLNSFCQVSQVQRKTESPTNGQTAGLAEISKRSEISDSEHSGDDDFLNWKLSAVDFESPAKLQSILGQEHQEYSSQEETEISMDDGYLLQNQQHSALGQWAERDVSSQPRQFYPEPKFQFRTSGIDPRILAQQAQAGASPSVEFSVPITQFLYVPSISTSEFPSIQASFGDIKHGKLQAMNFIQRTIGVSEKRLQVTCILLLKEWAYIAQQRKIVRNGVLDEQWNLNQQQRPSLRFNLVIGFARKLDKMFKIWVVNTAWMTCRKNIHLTCTMQILSVNFWVWKSAVLQHVALEKVGDEIRCAQVVGRAVYEAHITVKGNRELTERDMRGYTSLLRRAVTVHTWLQSPIVRHRRGDEAATKPRSFYGWKDVLRDSKLIRLHHRVEQIESLLAQEPTSTRIHEPAARIESASPSKFDRACLENLSREMLLSLGREDDDELQERIVMLLQIVAEVNQSSDALTAYDQVAESSAFQTI